MAAASSKLLLLTFENSVLLLILQIPKEAPSKVSVCLEKSSINRGVNVEGRRAPKCIVQTWLAIAYVTEFVDALPEV